MVGELNPALAFHLMEPPAEQPVMEVDGAIGQLLDHVEDKGGQDGVALAFWEPTEMGHAVTGATSGQLPELGPRKGFGHRGRDAALPRRADSLKQVQDSCRGTGARDAAQPPQHASFARPDVEHPIEALLLFWSQPLFDAPEGRSLPLSANRP